MFWDDWPVLEVWHKQCTCDAPLLWNSQLIPATLGHSSITISGWTAADYSPPKNSVTCSGCGVSWIPFTPEGVPK